MGKTVVLVDGGFYRVRAQTLWGDKKADERAKELWDYCMRHLTERNQKGETTQHMLYRIFYYDCPPINKKLFHPFLQRQVDFAKSDLYTWMNAFLEALKTKRKLALRLGKLSETQAYYGLKDDIIKKLCRKAITWDDLSEANFKLYLTQKGVDMKIGVDIASISFKKQVEQIVLISGDSDFVPAAKLARREGIDFILDPMGAAIKPDLFEHIDGKRSIRLKD